MNRLNLYLAGGIIALAVFIFLATKFEAVVDEYACKSDSDCVAEQACHPTSCINSNFKQDEGMMFCTAECAPGTLDCGQGSCQCVSNQCTAVFN